MQIKVQGYGLKPYPSACRKTCILMVAAFSRIFVFLLTCAAEKLLVSENRFISGFQGRVGGIGGSRAQSENPLEFRRAAFPPREWRLCRQSHRGTVLNRTPVLIEWVNLFKISQIIFIYFQNFIAHLFDFLKA